MACPNGVYGRSLPCSNQWRPLSVARPPPTWPLACYPTTLRRPCLARCCQEVIQNTEQQEPKWKQKLAAADAYAERTRQQTQEAHEGYKTRQAASRRLEATEVTPLRDLDFTPYLTDGGLITNCSTPDAKACVYAIFDKEKVLHFIGISRQVYMSMRLHFARMPSECYYVKYLNISKPSRSLLELIKEQWILENGTKPKGNDNGPQQNAWENPLDCKPLMTDEEKEKYEEAGAGPPKAKILKNVARRIEAELEGCFRERSCTERLRFDPKLKEKGLLDLKNT